MHLLADTMGTAALALKEKQINHDGPCYVHLSGRKSGLIDWLLTVFGVNTTTSIDVYADRIEYSYGSLSGNVLEVIPLSKVSNLVCGRFKPIILLVLAFICFLLAIPTLGLSLILTIIFLIYYFLKKSTLISIIPNSSSGVGVAFKRSVIENLNISDDEAKEIIKIIARLVEDANRK